MKQTAVYDTDERTVQLSSTAEMLTPRQVRQLLRFNQVEFASLIDVSVRKLSDLESGRIPLCEGDQRRIKEIEELTRKLAELMPETAVGDWLKRPNAAFGGFKPLELLHRGEVARIYEMVYMLKAGMPG